MSKKKLTSDETFRNGMILNSIGMLFFILLLFLIGIVLYLEKPENFFHNGLNFIYEGIFMFLILIYIYLTLNDFFKIIFSPVYFIIIKIKKIKNNEFYFKKFGKYISKTILFSLILLIVSFLHILHFEKTDIQELAFKFYLNYIWIYILIINFSYIFIKLYEKYKYSVTNSIFRFDKSVFLITIFFVIFGFVNIQIDKLNETDLSFTPYLNCSYPTASKNIVVVNHTISCDYSIFNSSLNYSIEFHNKYLKLNNKYNLTVNNKSLEIKFPEKPETYYIKLIENNKIFMEFNEINVVPYEKYYEVRQQIKSEKNNLFVGGWIAFFTVLFFTLEFSGKIKK